MDASNEKYAVYINELNATSSANHRPMILIVNEENQGRPKIIYTNEEFDKLLIWGITAIRLESDREFQKKCLDMFDSFSNTKDHFSITIGSKDRQVDFYCRSIRSLSASKSSDTPANHSDLIMAQVDMQEYQEMIRKYPVTSNIARYQSMVIDRQVEEQNAKLAELFDSMANLNDLIATQAELLKILKDHWFLRVTRKVSLKYIDNGIRITLIILSALNLLSPSISSSFKSALDQVVEIIINDTKGTIEP